MTVEYARVTKQSLMDPYTQGGEQLVRPARVPFKALCVFLYPRGPQGFHSTAPPSPGM
jgi:hypothetical protein